MYISLNWIKDYVDLGGVDVINLIKNRFTLAVAEIEGIEEKGKDLSGVVTAKILKVNLMDSLSAAGFTYNADFVVLIFVKNQFKSCRIG